MTASTPDPHSTAASRRDGVTALLLLGLVLAATVLGYRSAAPGTAADALPPVAAEDAAPAEATAGGGYDLDTAMKLAGDEVPQDKDGYYFVAFLEEAPPQQEIDELAAKLRLTADEHDYLGVTGPDPERNRRNLLAALKTEPAQKLDGAVVIYLGPAAQREELTRAVKATGADFRFVAYPEEASAPVAEQPPR